MLRKIFPWHRFYKGEEPNLAPDSLDMRYALHLIPGQQQRKQYIFSFVLHGDVPGTWVCKEKIRVVASGITPTLSLGNWQETAAC